MSSLDLVKNIQTNPPRTSNGESYCFDKRVKRVLIDVVVLSKAFSGRYTVYWVSVLSTSPSIGFLSAAKWWANALCTVGIGQHSVIKIKHPLLPQVLQYGSSLPRSILVVSFLN